MTATDPLPSWASRQASVILAMLEAVEAGVRNGTPADKVLHGLLQGSKKYGSRDRRIIRDAVFSWFRWHGAVGELPLPRGLCAAWALEETGWPPALLAILEDLGWSVDLLDGAPSAGRSLPERKVRVESAFGITLPEPDTWLPGWWQEETAHLGPFTDRLAEHIHRPPTWIRIDRILRESLHADLLTAGADWAGDASPCAYAFAEPGSVNHWLQHCPEGVEIQDLGSQQVVRICAPRAGQIWWDACCGAGGKSLQLLDEADRNLDLTCTDRREHVLKELVKRARRHGLGKVRRYPIDLLSGDLQLPNLAFDGVLLDAPCSGSGTWNRNPDAAWRTEHADVLQAARRQTRMLDAVAPALQPGGVLVYAVCSLTKSETLDVVETFRSAHPEYQLDPFPNPLTGTPTDGTLPLLPKDTNADGMYIARFVRN